MFRWRVSIFGKPLARPLGIITAPDDEKAATAKAIEFFGVEEALHFRVVVTKLDKAKSTHRAVTFASPPNPPKKPPAKDGLRPAKKQSLRAMGGHGAEAIGNIKPGAGIGGHRSRVRSVNAAWKKAFHAFMGVSSLQVRQYVLLGLYSRQRQFLLSSNNLFRGQGARLGGLR